jgi:hypothetical protein
LWLVYFQAKLGYKIVVPRFIALGESMYSKRLLVLAGLALLLAGLLVRSFTLVGDSQSTANEPSAGQTGSVATFDSMGRVEPELSPEVASGEGGERSIDENSGEVKGSLPLFRSAGAGYLRGAQPGRGGVELLARLGVKTLVDLRSKYDRTPGLEAEAEQAGLQYYWLPLSVWDPPDDSQTTEFLDVVGDQSRRPVYVFCTDGVNRTGEMTAIYRVMHDGWKIELALKEMDEAGFSPYYYSLRNYVWSYSRDRKQPVSSLKAAR